MSTRTQEWKGSSAGAAGRASRSASARSGIRISSRSSRPSRRTAARAAPTRRSPRRAASAYGRTRWASSAPGRVGCSNASRAAASSGRSAGSATARKPPVLAAVCLERLKTDASPYVPTGRPPTVEPIAWAASSISGMPSRSQRSRSSGAGSGFPYRLVVRTAESPLQTDSGTAAVSIDPSRGSRGACTGRSPAARTTKKMTSSLTGDISTRPPGAHQWRSAR